MDCTKNGLQELVKSFGTIYVQISKVSNESLISSKYAFSESQKLETSSFHTSVWIEWKWVVTYVMLNVCDEVSFKLVKSLSAARFATDYGAGIESAGAVFCVEKCVLSQNFQSITRLFFS